MDNNIKIIRLQSGEDVIANYVEDAEYEKAILGKPMHVIFKRIPTGQTVMLMMPWLPIELIKENSAEIYTSDILTIIDPRDDLVKYYYDIVKEADSRMEKQLDLNYFGSLGDDEEEDDDYESEITEEEFEAILKEKKENKLH